jgi:hypothetical protein
MKQTISKVVFWMYVLSTFFFYEEIFMPFSFLHKIDYVKYGYILVVFVCFIPVFLFLILLALDFKKFFKLKYLLINIIPILFSILLIGDISKYGLI